jgi:hypothetical protein
MQARNSRHTRSGEQGQSPEDQQDPLAFLRILLRQNIWRHNDGEAQLTRAGERCLWVRPMAEQFQASPPPCGRDATKDRQKSWGTRVLARSPPRQPADNRLKEWD